MADEVITRILEIKTTYADAVKGLADYMAKLEEARQAEADLRKAIQESGEATEEDRKTLAAIKSAQREYSKGVQTMTKEIQNNIKMEQQQEGSLTSLRAELSNATKAYDDLSETERNGAKGEELAQHINEITDRLKEAEEGTQRFYRSVGSYSQALDENREKVAELVKELAGLTAAGKQNSDEFKAAKEQLDLYSNSITSGGVKATKTYQKGILGLIGTMSIMTNLIGTDTEEGQKLRSIMQKLQIVTASLAAITKIYNALQKTGIIQRISQNLQIKAGVAAIRLETAAKTGNTVATTAATVAQKALNAAMKANPIVLLVSAVAALGTALVGLVKWLSTATSAQREATAAQKEYERQSRATALALAELESREKTRDTDMALRHDAELKRLMESGATTEEIEEKKREQQRETLEQEKAVLKDREELEREAVDEAVANYQAQQRRLDELIARKGEDAKATDAQREKVEEAKQKVIDACDAVNDTIRKTSDITRQIAEDDYNAAQTAAEADRKRSEERLARIREEQEAAERAAAAELADIRKATDMRIAAMDEGYEKEAARENEAYGRELADLQKRLDTETDMTVAQREAVQEQVEILTRTHNQKLADLDAQRAADEAKALADREAAERQSAQTTLELRLQLAEKGSREELELRKQQVQMEMEERLADETLTGEQIEMIRKLYNTQLAAMDAEFFQNEIDARKKAKQDAIKIETQKMQAIGAVFGGLSDILDQFGEDNKAAAIASKVLALGQIAVQTGVAIANGVSQAIAAGPFPANLAAIATTVATVLANIATAISTVKGAEFATGGIVTGPGTGTSDSVSARLSNGESVNTALATAMFAPLYSALNQLGGGAAYTGGGAEQYGEDVLARAFARGASCIRPVVSVKEITDTQSRVGVLENIGRV